MILGSTSLYAADYSISLGQKTLHTEVTFNLNSQDSVAPVASSTAIFTNITYHQTPELSFAIEYALFSNSHSAELSTTSAGFRSTPSGDVFELEESEYKVTVKPTNYLSFQTNYTFRPTKTFRPFLFTGLSYIAVDIQSEFQKTVNDNVTEDEISSESDSSIGLTYGAGFNIHLFHNAYFVFDYRIQQDIADQPANEMSGAFRYQF